MIVPQTRVIEALALTGDRILLPAVPPSMLSPELAVILIMSPETALWSQKVYCKFTVAVGSMKAQVPSIPALLKNTPPDCHVPKVVVAVIRAVRRWK